MLLILNSNFYNTKDEISNKQLIDDLRYRLIKVTFDIFSKDGSIIWQRGTMLHILHKL